MKLPIMEWASKHETRFKGINFTLKLKVLLPAYSIIQLATILEKTAIFDESKYFGNKISGIFSKIVYRIRKENITIEI